MHVDPPESASNTSLKAVIFDLYGTLIDAPNGGVRPDTAADPMLREILKHGNWRTNLEITLPDEIMESPSQAIYQAVRDHHTNSACLHPEVDLRLLWKRLLKLPESVDAGPLVVELHSAWNPVTWIDGAREALGRAQQRGWVLGILSNAQFDTLSAINSQQHLFRRDLMLLSFQHGIAKPSPMLFLEMINRLSGYGIRPVDVLYIGNDPAQDIQPARNAGFHTLLFHREIRIPPPIGFSKREILTNWSNFLPEAGS